MDLSAEVMQVSMRVNQRYFALRRADGSAAPYFAFAANIAATDGGTAIIAGNERVLRARFSDARHFWDLDQTRPLESRVPALNAITFHAQLGSQGARTRRLEILAKQVALVPSVGANPTWAKQAARLAKADLTTGMVGEFPELQGVIGGYYARQDGQQMEVADAIGGHYAPKGQADIVPTAPVTVSVALADKLDTLAAFFVIGEKPSGSGDPFALRRAALGAIRIIRENKIRISLREILFLAVDRARSDQKEVVRDQFMANPDFDHEMSDVAIIARAEELNRKAEQKWLEVLLKLGNKSPGDLVEDLFGFLTERLRIQLRAEGSRHDVLAAILSQGFDDDLTRLLARTDALASMVATPDGTNLQAAAKRAANILRIEEKKDGPHDGSVDPALFAIPQEELLSHRLDSAIPAVQQAMRDEQFTQAMSELATLRVPLDAFFAVVTVNDENPDLRRNRLRLLSRVRAAMFLAADFSKIDG
jgi:glycyl-tRNA synthetase beta chain